MGARRLFGLVAVLLAGCATGARAGGLAPPLTPDLLTISGRFALPRAAAGTPSLDVSAAAAAPGAADGMKVKPEYLEAVLRQAVTRSLINFGYHGDGTAALIAVDLAEPELALSATEAKATMLLHVKAAGDPSPLKCLPFTAVGRFRALAPVQSGDGRRAFGVAATVALAFAGASPGIFLMDQFDTASAQRDAINSRRKLNPGESVAPDEAADAMTRHAVINATQLAVADLIARLGSDDCRADATVAGSLQSTPSAPVLTGAQFGRRPTSAASTSE